MQLIAKINGTHLPAKPWEVVTPEAVSLTSDGLQAEDSTSLRLYFRPQSQKTVMLEACLSNKEAGFNCTIGGYGFILNGENNPGAKITLNNWVLGATGKFSLPPEKCALTCNRGLGLVSLKLDGRTILEVKDPRPKESIPDLEFFLPAGALIHSIVVRGESSQTAGLPLVNKKNYNLYACIDFFDDLIAAPWTQQTLRDLVDIYCRHHIKRIYFIDHGGYHSGFWDHYDPKRYPVTQNAKATYENIGDFLPAIVSAGHEAGLEVYAVHKPQECAFPVTYPYGSKEAEQFGRVPRLDGMMWWLVNFVAEHPEMRLERDMRSVPSDLADRMIDRIVLTPEKDLDKNFDPRQIRLWVSADNAGYVPYGGCPVVQTLADGKVVLSRLAIKEKYMALTVEGNENYRFGNVLRDLISVYDQKGQLMPFSYASLTQPRNLPVNEAGFVFDYPISNVGEMENYYWLDGVKPLAIAKGRERYLCGVLCEAYPEVRQYWLDDIDYYIKSGADGVDMRNLVHTRTFDWDVFGYNPPLVAAFKEKYGIDMLSESYQRADLRRLRGEFYEKFIWQAKRRLQTAGKKMHLHVSPLMKSPDWHTVLDVWEDWEAWIEKGLADEITLKMSWLTSENAVKVFQLARQKGLPVNYCPYFNGVPQRKHGRSIIDYFARQALEVGADGLIAYENYAFMQAQADGRMRLEHPWLLEVLQRYSRP